MLIRYRLRTANILLITMKALSNEIAKNLVLAGIGAMTILDNEVVVDDDLGSQFFVSEQHVGMNVQLSPAFEVFSNTNVSTSEQRQWRPRFGSSTQESHCT